MTTDAHFLIDDNTGEYVAMSDDNAYQQDWQVPEPDTYIASPVTTGPGEVSSLRGAPKPLTSISRGNGQASVRLNTTLSFNGSIPFSGTVSGSIASGSVFRGRDSNGNGIPDLLEKCLKIGTCRFE